MTVTPSARAIRSSLEDFKAWPTFFLPWSNSEMCQPIEYENEILRMREFRGENLQHGGIRIVAFPADILETF
jgi:hypothetical protein